MIKLMLYSKQRTMLISSPKLYQPSDPKDPHIESIENITANLDKLKSELQLIQTIVEKSFEALLSSNNYPISNLPIKPCGNLSIEYLKLNQPYNRLISIIEKSKSAKETILGKILKLNFSLGPKKRKSKYKMYSPNTKEQVIESIRSGLSLKEATIKFSVPTKSVKRWLVIGPHRKIGCGRKIRDPELESNMINWYNENKSLYKITSSTFRRKALTLSKDRNFKASKGWLEKLKRKYGFKLDREK